MTHSKNCCVGVTCHSSIALYSMASGPGFPEKNRNAIVEILRKKLKVRRYRLHQL